MKAYKGEYRIWMRSLFSGLILQSQIQKDRQAFEFRLQLADWEYKRQTKKEDADENGL